MKVPLNGYSHFDVGVDCIDVSTMGHQMLYSELRDSTIYRMRILVLPVDPYLRSAGESRDEIDKGKSKAQDNGINGHHCS